MDKSIFALYAICIKIFISTSKIVKILFLPISGLWLMTKGPSNWNVAEPWQPERSRAGFGLQALPECTCRHGWPKHTSDVSVIPKKLSMCPPHYGPRQILKLQDLAEFDKSLYHFCKTLGPVECLASALYLWQPSPLCSLSARGRAS